MSWLAVVLWGGAVGVDATSFPQVMISRPIVAAPVTGLLLGQPLAGVAVGVLLEVFALVILPIGAARYPESGTAAVAATVAYAGTAGAEPRPDLLLLAIVFALAWERVGGASVNALRRLNERLVASAGDGRSLSGRRLEALQLAVLGLDFVRGALVTVVGAGVALVVLRQLGALWALGPVATVGVLGVAAAAMTGAALSLFDGWSERRIALGLGVLCGLTLLLAG